MSIKYNKEIFLDSIAFALLFLAPIILLFQSQDFPLINKSFFVFLIFILIGALVFYAVMFYCKNFSQLVQFIRCVTFIVGSTFLVMRMSDVSFWPALYFSTLIIYALRAKVNRILIIATLAISISSSFANQKLHPIQVIENNQLFDNKLVEKPSNGPVFHLIFDEAMGDAGFFDANPAAQAAKMSLLNVLERHGFSTLKNAYSTAQLTKYSLGYMINLKRESNIKLVSGENKYYIDANPLFNILKQNGYNINVYQSEYLDYCSYVKSLIASCYAYPKHSLFYFKPKEFNQLRLVIPYVLHILKLGNHLSRVAERAGIKFFKLDSTQLPSIGALSERVVRKKLLADIEKFKGTQNQYYFAHFLYPHFSYIQDQDCNIKPNLYQWTDGGEFEFTEKASDPLRISKQERDKYYMNYYQQFTCFAKTLDNLLVDINKTHPNATIIIHGDHSSRLSTRYIVDRKIENFKYLDQQNYQDLYPTLLSVKYPDNRPGLKDCSISLLEFMQQVFLSKVEPITPFSKNINETLFKNNKSCIPYAQALSQSLIHK